MVKLTFFGGVNEIGDFYFTGDDYTYRFKEDTKKKFFEYFLGSE